MQTYLLNFSRTGVDSVIEALCLSGDFKEIKINDFFDNVMYETIVEFENCTLSNSVDVLGGGVIAINYPLNSQREQDFVREFIRVATKQDKNLYYYPKPNAYTDIDDFALFSLKQKITSENLKVESLCREGLLPVQLRNKMHRLLRESTGAPLEMISKHHYMESRKLFNLSYDWEAYPVPKEQLEYDLIERFSTFYKRTNNICISTINICNLECIMCPQHNKELRKKFANSFFDKKQVLDERAVYRVIDYLAEDIQFDTVLSFVATGEILLDKRLPDFIAYGKSKGIPRIAIITNGVLLEEQCIRLLDAGLNSITISIDGATPETYYKIRGVDLAQVERGVRKSVEYARALNAKGANIEIWLNCVLVEDTQVASERGLYIEKWKDCRDIIKTLRFIKEANYRESDDPLLSHYDNYDDGYVCSKPWRAEVIINCYGDVTPCCNMSATSFMKNTISASIGNILEMEDFNEIWNSPKAMELRKESLRCDFKCFKCCKTCVGKYLDNPAKMAALHSEYER